MNRYRRWIAGLFCLGMGAIAQAQELAVASQILDGETHSMFSFSPSGESFAYLYRTRGGNEIRVVNIEDWEETARIDVRDFVPQQIAWASDDRLLVGARGLWSMTPDGEELQTLLEYEPEEDERLFGGSSFMTGRENWRLRHTLPDDPEHVLLESFDIYDFSRLHRLNLFTGVVTDVISGRDAQIKRWWLAPDGTPVIGVREKGDSKIHYVLDGDTGELWSHDKRFENGPVQFDYTEGPRYRRSHAPYTILAGGDEVLITELNAAGRYQIVRYNLNSGQRRAVVAADARYDVGTDVSRSHVLYDTETGDLHAVGYQAQTFTYVSDSERHTVLLETLGSELGKPYYVYTRSNDDAQWIVRARDMTTYGDWFVFDTTDNSLKLIGEDLGLDDRAWLPSARLGQITTRDGLQLDTALLMPHPDMDIRGLIVSLQYPEYGRARFEWDEDLYYLASRGFSVMMINPRGNIGYGRAFFEDGLRNHLALLSSDLTDAVAFAREAGWDNGRGVFGFGLGQGGTLLYNAANTSPTLFDAIVTYHCMVDLPRFAKWLRKEEQFTSSNYWQSVAAAPGNKKALDALSLKRQLDTFNTPWQTFHHETNVITDADAMQKLIKKIQKRDVDVVYRNVGAQRLVYSSTSMQTLFLDMTMKFFDRYSPEETIGIPLD